ncbi:MULTISPECIES: hypothetical protein [Sphingomonas]|jgi:hypothetical protein|uniref:Uncharacterized protein n=1 Tax=Sphingomonas paucimobilis TaxID=13689 RepID=A0A7Y2PDJ9_SPHPI|nr:MULTISPECIES: hypothetical protein [Sphingomonas]MCM3681204.1 hypothetical protein [Sphingomonas paucimobilis]NNG57146.1 hypothetical protein [Sphingomonas paucimobilis]QPT11148.1 hypothetical protein I6G38_19760 [Sphingomonas paucimobilis]
MKHGKDLQPFGFEERVLGKQCDRRAGYLGSSRPPWNQQGKNCAPLVKISYNPKFTSVNRYRDALALSAVSTNGTDLRL